MRRVQRGRPPRAASRAFLSWIELGGRVEKPRFPDTNSVVWRNACLCSIFAVPRPPTASHQPPTAPLQPPTASRSLPPASHRSLMGSGRGIFPDCECVVRVIASGLCTRVGFVKRSTGVRSSFRCNRLKRQSEVSEFLTPPSFPQPDQRGEPDRGSLGGICEFQNSSPPPTTPPVDAPVEAVLAGDAC